MRRISLLVVLAVLLVSAWHIGLDVRRIWLGLPDMGALLVRMASPQWSYAAEAAAVLLETLKMAAAGALLGTVLGLPLAIAAAANTSPHPLLYRAIRVLLAGVRTIPHVVWAALLVTVFSIGRGAGVMALTITAANVVAKLLSEYIENLEGRQLEALTGVGAGWGAMVVYGVLPRIAGQVWSLLFFTLEVNVRAATVLGLVGAGGIGQLLWRDLNFLRYDRLATLILILFVTVGGIDGLSWLARKLQVETPAPNFSGYRAFRMWQGAKLAAGLAATAAAVLWCCSLLDISRARFVLGLGQARVVLVRMLDWDWSYLPRLGQGLAESLSIAVFATIAGSLAAVPAAFLGATNLWRNRTWPFLNKAAVNLIRTFPAVILAIMFFRGVGPGPLAGALALTVYTAGVLGKLYTEAVEAVDGRCLEALAATGASPVQVWYFGLLPRVLPDFLTASLYRLESNMRTATILGIVGAGGIGTWLMMNLAGRNWERVGLLLAGLIASVLLVDTVSGILRRRLT
ncbi:MAG: phosphonate ABC transporter, permease protein PhnE [Firmicutes bacterium]|nr:phosphonate ABC transporter, permease protein PhnE [Bacillota bacterium]